MANTTKFTAPIRVGSNAGDPADTDVGILYYDSNTNSLKYRDNVSYKPVLKALADDPNPTLSGDLDVLNNDITSSTGDINIVSSTGNININSSGDIVLLSNGSVQRASGAPGNYIEDQYIHAITLNDGETDAIITELTFDPLVFESIHATYKLKDSAGEVRSGSFIAATNGTTPAFFDGPTVETGVVDISFNAVIQPVGGVAAFFTGQVAGMTTDVTITADNVGVIGNSVSLMFDGIVDIDAAIAAWNLANPANTVTLTSGNGAQVPDNLEVINLAFGVDGVMSVTITYTSGAESAIMRVDVKRIQA